jgi:hypothetical protein
VSYYVIKDKYTLPGFVFLTIASWAVVLAGVSIVLLADWGISATMHFDVISSLRGPLRFLLNLAGAYAGLGGICLYITMWVYWIAIERSPIWTRIVWLLALLLLLPYGALIYAIVAWRRDIVKINGEQPIGGSSVTG